MQIINTGSAFSYAIIGWNWEDKACFLYFHKFLPLCLFPIQSVSHLYYLPGPRRQFSLRGEKCWTSSSLGASSQREWSTLKTSCKGSSTRDPSFVSLHLISLREIVRWTIARGALVSMEMEQGNNLCEPEDYWRSLRAIRISLSSKRIPYLCSLDNDQPRYSSPIKLLFNKHSISLDISNDNNNI